MKFKPIRFIPGRHQDSRSCGSAASASSCRASCRSPPSLLFVFVGLNVGVDFKGGTVMTIRTAQPANIEQLRDQVNGARLRPGGNAGVRLAQ